MVEMPRLRHRVERGVKVASVVILTASLTALAGCTGAESPPAACAPQASTLSSIDPATGNTTWQTDLTQASESPLQVFDGTVVVAGPCGVAAVDLADGDVLHDDEPPGVRFGVINAIGVIGDLLIVRDEPDGGDNGHVTIPLAEDAPGYSYSTNVPFRGATVTGGHLITLYGSSLTSLVPGDARPGWDIPVPACCPDLHLHSANLLLLTGGDGSTYAIDVADGDVVWRSIPPVASLGYAIRVTSVPGTVLEAARTSAAPASFFVYATDARTGRLRWTHPAVGVPSADRQITVLRADDAVEALDTRSGDLLWRHPAPTVTGYESTPAAALTSDTVVIQQIGATAMGLDRTTGEVLWGGLETTSVLAAGDVVLAVTDEGVTAIEARTGAARWSLTHERTSQQLAVSPDGQLLYLDSDLPPQPVMNDCC